MAKKAQVVKKGNGRGFDRCYVAAVEAGGTLQKPFVIQINVDVFKYNGLSADEKTALRALTIANIIDLAEGTPTEF